MRAAYDFHIHTAVSPCAHELMSPHNIVNMAILNGLQVIAITDHNTCANCQSVMHVGAENGLLVIPGMEIECQEEFHSIALFPNLEAALAVEAELARHRMPIKNRPEIFGEQLRLDAVDQVVGIIEELLITAIQLPASSIYELVRAVGGVIYPAHIDRNAYSILSNLGSIPEELKITHVELSVEAKQDSYKRLVAQGHILLSSDAHYLEQLCVCHEMLEIDELRIEKVLKALKG
ncbi:MAG: PHP domain-containing protein [Cellulosilyticaceae bacterium]